MNTLDLVNLELDLVWINGKRLFEHVSAVPPFCNSAYDSAVITLFRAFRRIGD